MNLPGVKLEDYKESIDSADGSADQQVPGKHEDPAKKTQKEKCPLPLHNEEVVGA